MIKADTGKRINELLVTYELLEQSKDVKTQQRRHRKIARLEKLLVARGLKLGPALAKHPTYLAFLEARAAEQTLRAKRLAERYDPKEQDLIELGEAKIIERQAVMDVSGDDIDYTDVVTGVSRYSVYVDTVSKKLYTDASPDSDFNYEHLEERYVDSEWLEKAEQALNLTS